LRPAYSASTRQFNHNNPFSSQLERERIISEEKLKQRFDDAYTSKYQGGGGYQHQDTPALSANGRYS
jgi:N-methylhydantoinase B/oxoprolinase/acetone carboxylase alpha subunit